jgi:hypothetical protein
MLVAFPSDLQVCSVLVRKMHRLCLLQRGLNKYNFLIADAGAALLDFETVRQSGDEMAMRNELEGLREQLLDESGKGGVVLTDEGN